MDNALEALRIADDYFKMNAGEFKRKYPEAKDPRNFVALKVELAQPEPTEGAEGERGFCVDCVHAGARHDIGTGKCGMSQCDCKGYMNANDPIDQPADEVTQ